MYPRDLNHHVDPSYPGMSGTDLTRALRAQESRVRWSRDVPRAARRDIGLV
jgi:hypothetical protein